MNGSWKYILFFLGGAAVGALGTAALIKNKDSLKPMAANLLSRGLDARDAVARRLETMKENAEDLLAEARQESERRKEAASEAAEPEKA